MTIRSPERLERSFNEGISTCTVLIITDPVGLLLATFQKPANGEHRESEVTVLPLFEKALSLSRVTEASQ